MGAPFDDTGATDSGAVHILMLNSDGTVKRQVKLANSRNGMGVLNVGDLFGMSLSPLGDFNQDGVNDLLVGAPSDDTNGSDAGALYFLLLNSNGTVKSVHKLTSGQKGMPNLSVGDRFGISVAPIDDQDGDGVIDIAVGADQDDEFGSDSGAIYLLNLKRDFSVKSSTKVTQSVLPAASEVMPHFGRDISVIGDLKHSQKLTLTVSRGVAQTSGSGAGYFLSRAQIRFLAIGFGEINGQVSPLFQDTDGDLATNLRDGDADNDGIPDYDECLYGEILCKQVDDDNDGVPDYVDVDRMDSGDDTLGSSNLVTCIAPDGRTMQRRVIDFVIAIDVSGSTSNPAENVADSKSVIEKAAEAASYMISLFDPQDRVGLVPFSSPSFRVKIRHSLGRSAITSDHQSVLEDLKKYTPSAVGGTTLISEALIYGNQLFNLHSDTDSPKVLVILSDGQNFANEVDIPINYSRLELDKYVGDVSQSLKSRSSVNIFTITYQSNLVESIKALMTELASDPTYAYFSPDFDSLNEVFDNMTGDVCNLAFAKVLDKCPNGTVCLDTDGDGKLDSEDEDSDNDGTLDKDECNAEVVATVLECPDADRDGIKDYLDPDTNGDNPAGNANSDINGNGISDKDECGTLVGVYCEDKDGDLIPDYFDEDKDNDGILDKDECVLIGQERVCFDTDGDGTPDYRDEDSDNDGILDSEECAGGCGDTDRDGIPDSLDPDINLLVPNDKTTGDADSNGVSDKEECAGGFPCPDTDGDLIPDYFDTDDDNNGVLDINEVKPEDATPNDEISNPTDNTGGDGSQESNNDDSGTDTDVSDENGGNQNDPTVTEQPIIRIDLDNDGIPDMDECHEIDEKVVCFDTDGDGKPDNIDEDSDDDGTLDKDECDLSVHLTVAQCPDEDQDGIKDYLDPDTNAENPGGNAAGDVNDNGVPDGEECAKGDRSYCADTDGDLIPDYFDEDKDNDGILDKDECVLIGQERVCFDTDGDGTPDYRDEDSDNDGTLDKDECNAEVVATVLECPDADGDGIKDYLDPDTNGDNPAGNANSDINGNGISDKDECGTLVGVYCEDKDGDLIPDYFDEDKDNDGILDKDECVLIGQERVCFDTDGDGKPDYRDEDSDNDGTLDKDECNASTVLECPDADGDGIKDYLDPDTNGDNPAGNANSDINGNGISDKDECGTLVGVYCEDKDGDLIPDYFDEDKDNDGILDKDECVLIGQERVCFDTDGDGTPDYRDEDSDNDGILDSEECAGGCGDTDRDGIPDSLDPDINLLVPNDKTTGDADNNGVSDKEECAGGFPCPDTDGDLIPDYFDTDDDNNGIPDIEECVDGDCENDASVGNDGSVDPEVEPTPDDSESSPTPVQSPEVSEPVGEPPVSATPEDPAVAPPVIPPSEKKNDDSEATQDLGDAEDRSANEGDGNPLDSDNDGIPDSIECFGGTNCQDTDGDGLPNYQDPDSDNDFVPDSVECPDARKCPDTDRDGIPDFLDNDTNDSNPSGNANGDVDSDGIVDRIECPNWLVCFDSDNDRIPDMSEENEIGVLIDLRPILGRMLGIAKRVQEIGDSSLGYVYSKNTRRRPLLNGIQGLESMKLSAEVGDERAKIAIKQVGAPLCTYNNGRRGRPYSRVLELSGQRYRDSLKIIGEELPIYSHNPSLVDRQVFRCSRPNVRAQIAKLSRLVKATRDMVLVNYRQCELEDSRTKRFSQSIISLYEQFRKYEKLYLKRLVICEPLGDSQSR